MKRLFLFVIIPVVLLTSCEPINVSPDAGSILSDYRDRWIGEYACQYGCVHSYAEAMDTANFLYDQNEIIRIKKYGDNQIYLFYQFGPVICNVDSAGHVSSPFQGQFFDNKFEFSRREVGIPIGYRFTRYKCEKRPPRKKSR